MYCFYKDCPNISRTFNSKPFFNLPTDEPRRDVWIKNSGNGSRLIDWDKRKLFCEDHFDPKYIRRQFNRTTLRRDAVPYPYSSQDVIEFIEMTESEEDPGSESEQLQLEVLTSNEEKGNFQQGMKRNQPQNSARTQNLNPKLDIASDDVCVLIYDGNEISNDGANEVANSSRSSQNTKKIRIISEQPHRINANINTNSSANTSHRPFQKRTSIHKSEVPSAATKEIPQNQKSANNVDLLVSSTEKYDSNSEETYFALSLVGILKRLPPHKRAMAKCHILNYLTELEYGSAEHS